MSRTRHPRPHRRWYDAGPIPAWSTANNPRPGTARDRRSWKAARRLTDLTASAIKRELVARRLRRDLAEAVETPRPLTDDQRSDLHCVWTCCVANGGRTRLETKPRALIRRGLVHVSFAGSRHAPSLYTLTEEGLALALEIDAEREAARAASRERAAINASNRVGNIDLGGALWRA